MYVIKFGSQTIPYDLLRSDSRKSISISVDENGVRVVAPTEANTQKIEDLVSKKAPWIRKQLLYFNEVKKETSKRLFLSGEKLPYLGRNYRLKIIKETNSKTVDFRFHQGRFEARIPNSLETSQYRDALYPLYTDWIKSRGESFAKERYKRFTNKFEYNPQKIIIRDPQKRWGSCTPNGTIILNWKVFLAPTSIIDYVLVHELAHLKHMDHSPEYWETVRMLLPDYEERKEWLRVHGKTLQI